LKIGYGQTDRGNRSLKVLDAACRHLNFTRAAAELKLTPAAVSHQIKEFELSSELSYSSVPTAR